MIMSNFTTYGQYIYDISDHSIHSVEFLARPKSLEVPMDLDSFFSIVQDHTLEKWFQYQLQQAIFLYNKTGIRAQVNLDLRTIKKLDRYILNNLPSLNGFVTIEITQIQGIPTKDVVNSLHSIAPDNIRIALDDLEATNDLARLKEYNFHEIKVDRSMVKMVETDYLLSRKLLVIKDTFDVDIIIEGVENIHQLNVLKNLGFNLFQGFYFSRPKPLTEILVENNAEQHIEELSKILYIPATIL